MSLSKIVVVSAKKSNCFPQQQSVISTHFLLPLLLLLLLCHISWRGIHNLCVFAKFLVYFCFFSSSPSSTISTSPPDFHVFWWDNKNSQSWLVSIIFCFVAYHRIFWPSKKGWMWGCMQECKARERDDWEGIPYSIYYICYLLILSGLWYGAGDRNFLSIYLTVCLSAHPFKCSSVLWLKI